MFEPNEPQAPFAPTELDTQVADFISTAQTEFGEPAAAETQPEPAMAETPAGESTAAPAPASPAPQAPAPSDVSPEVGRGLDRLVAREVELREREARLSGAEKEMEALKARLRELEPRALSQEHLDNIRLSPHEGLRALGLDPDEVIRAALVQKLGDKADPQMKEMLERTRLQKEMLALKAQVQEAERRQAAQAYFNQVANGARDFLAKHEEISKHDPLVAQVARTNPDRVYSEIMEEITRDAAVRATREPNGDILSYGEAVKRVGERWGNYQKLFTGPGSSSTASTPPASAPVPETKQNVGSPKPATIKPPDKPLAPWLNRNQSEEDAIRLAIAEYNKPGNNT